MRWEELSMSDRSNLMKTYLQNGVTQLSDMRDHYNKFADGGEVDNVHSTQAQDFIASWLSNRQEQFRENFRNSGSTMIPYSILPKSWSDRAAFKEYQNQLKNLRTVKQYDVLGNTKFPHVPDSEFESIKKLSNHTGGAYNPSTHAISYISPYAGTDVHELTHSLNADPQINAIKYGFEGDKLQEGKQYNSYKDSANEIYSRLMQFRYLNKLDPTKKYSVEDIKKWREKYDDTDIVNRYTDEYLLHLLNNVASTKSSLEKDGRKLAAFGGPLRDEYDNPDQYYDYKTAEEVGNMYDPKSKHWASRDPRTGMILKNSKHPTFGMAIREDQSSGYAPFIDSSTGRYYTLRPEEYATSPYKPTLRRVNNFDGGGYTGISIIPKVEYTDFPMTNYVERRDIQKERAVRADMTRRFVEEENGKDRSNSGYDKKTNRWYPHDSVEGGEKTIGYGFKLNKGKKDPLQKIVEKQGYLTDEQVNNTLDSIAGVYLDKARKIYDSRFSEGSFDSLGFKVQSVLGDVQYNPGLKDYKFLTKAAHSGDIPNMKRHSKRYLNKRELGRNKGVERDLDSVRLGFYNPFDY